MSYKSLKIDHHSHINQDSDLRVRIDVHDIKKTYKIYDKPENRLKEMILGKINNILFRKSEKNFHTEFTALNNISFKVYEGESLGIIGLNGAGKSTLLKIISGILFPTGGQINIYGRVTSILELGAGFNPEFTGRENIYMNASILGFSRDQIRDKFNVICNFADIGEFIDKPVKIYSSGMYLRLAFSVATHCDPDILIVDEVISVGDTFFQQKCNIHMRENMKNVTKILVTHDMSAIANMTDRAIVLNEGEIYFEGAPLEAIEQYTHLGRETPLADSNINNGISQSQDTDIAPIGQNLQWMDIDKEHLSGTLNIQIEQFAVQVDGREYPGIMKSDSNVTCFMKINVEESSDNPIIGYLVMDRFGNPVFGENTCSMDVRLGELDRGVHTTQFSFDWPKIAEGEYFLTIGLGRGTDPMVHEIDCWAHNVFNFKSSADAAVHGLFNNRIKTVSID